MWETVGLGEVTTFVRGLTYSKKDEVEGDGIAVLRATNIDLSTHKIVLDEIRWIQKSVTVKDSKFARTGDLLICTASGSKSHVGKVALIEEDLGMAFGGFMAAIRCNEECLPKFLYHVLTSQSFKNHLARLGDGANINNLKFSQIEGYTFPLPPLPEQQRIIAKLDATFAEIDKTIEITNRDLEQTSILFQSFMKHIYEGLFSECSRISVGEACEFYNGKAHEKDIDDNGGFVVVNSKFISTYGTIRKYTNQQMFPLYEGDIVLVMSDVPNGKALAKTYKIECDNLYSLNQRICCIRSKNYVPSFLQTVLDRNSHFLKFDNGENQTNLRKADILSCPLPVLSIDEQYDALVLHEKFTGQSSKRHKALSEKLRTLQLLKSKILTQQLEPREAA